MASNRPDLNKSRWQTVRKQVRMRDGNRCRVCGALCRRSVRPNRHKPGERFIREYRDEPMGDHGLHKWWYACLERASVVASGQTSGERMHKARHTAGQRVLDRRRAT